MKKQLLLFLLVLPLAASAYDAEIDGIYYDLSDTTAVVTKSPYSKYSGDVVIPLSVIYSGKTYSVKRIGESAFRGCTGLTSITIPESVTSISKYAFSGCTGLTSITIPNSVRGIGNWAFDGCTKLEDVYIDIIDFGHTNLCYDIARKKHYLYKGEEITGDFTIPESVTTIGNRAFYGCGGLTSITIPNSVTSIGYDAFFRCTGLTSINIPNSVTSIGKSAFSGCRGLTSINIPNSVTSIGESAFSGCRGLTSVTIPESVTSISKYTFDDCTGLTSITIPNSVTSIGQGAFYRNSEGAKSLTIYLGDNVKTLENNALGTGYKTYIYTNSGNLSLVKTLWELYYDNIYDVATNKKISTPKWSLHSSSPTALTIKIENLFERYEYNCGGQTITKDNAYAIYTQLDPDKQYRFCLTISLGKNSCEINKYYKTSALELKTLQPKVVSSGNVVVAAESNITDNDETNVGFEWRRIDWTDEFASNTSSAYIYNGTIEGYIRNVNPEKLWKVRPYYLSASGTYYYGDWVGLDPSNTSYFEPTVRTYAKVTIEGNAALVKGYTLGGSDKVSVQGFKYWKTLGSGKSAGYPQATNIPDDAMTVIVGAGQAMSATLTNLDYDCTYSYVAFATTVEGETFYGEEQTFKTEEPDAVIGIQAGTPANGAVRVYTMTGSLVYTGAEEEMNLNRGLYIIRDSDGRNKKILVK